MGFGGAEAERERGGEGSYVTQAVAVFLVRQREGRCAVVGVYGPSCGQTC